MQKITVGCDACDAQVRVSSEYRGRRVRCPRCEEPIAIPESEEDLLEFSTENEDRNERPLPAHVGQSRRSRSSRRRREATRRHYVSQTGTTLVLTILIAFTIVLLVVVEVATIYRIILCRKFLNGAEHLLPALFQADQFVSIPAGIYILNVFLIIIPFLIWLYRANRNAAAISGKDLSIGPVWSVCSWFVPLANFVVPCVAMLEIVKASSHGKLTWLRKLVGWWWAFWIIRLVGGQVAQVLAAASDSLESLIISDTFRAVAFLPELIATLLFLWLIRSVSSLQRKNAP